MEALAAPDRTVKFQMPPTNHQVRETCDTIFAFTANPIFGKLHFYVIISSAIDLKLKRSLIRIAKRNLRILANAENGDYIKPGDSSQLEVL